MKIVIVVERGVVQTVYTDQPAEVLVEDYDPHATVPYEYSGPAATYVCRGFVNRVFDTVIQTQVDRESLTIEP